MNARNLRFGYQMVTACGLEREILQVVLQLFVGLGFAAFEGIPAVTSSQGPQKCQRIHKKPNNPLARRNHLIRRSRSRREILFFFC